VLGPRKGLAGTLRERKDQRRNMDTTVQEKKEPGSNKLEMRNGLKPKSTLDKSNFVNNYPYLAGFPAATTHWVIPVKKTRNRGGTRLYLMRSYIMVFTHL
jgi:hypothetical protein